MCEVPNSMNMIEDMPEDAGGSYNYFCESSGCEEYIEWEFHGQRRVSCKKVGQTEDILEYPKDCNFLASIQKLVLTR